MNSDDFIRIGAELSPSLRQSLAYPALGHAMKMAMEKEIERDIEELSKGARIREARNTGIKVEVKHKHGNQVVDPGPGKHLWIVTGVWRVLEPNADTIHMDGENLITIDGPGCFKCEEMWSPELASRPCNGSVEWMP